MALNTKQGPRWRNGVWMVAIALAAFGVARFTSPARSADAPAARPADAAPVPAAPASLVGQRVPDTPFLGLDNRTHRMSEMLGKPVMLSVFAYDCDHCQAELPKAQAFFRKHQPAGLTFWAVDGSNGTRDDVLGFGKKFKFDAPLFYDPKAALADALQVDGYPMFYWVDRQGIIRAQVPGEFRDKDFEWLWKQYGRH